MMVEQFPQIEVILFPYTAKTKVLPEDSIFDAAKKCGVGIFGIKPFASNSLFKGNSAPGNPHAEEDDRRARLAIRYILCTLRQVCKPVEPRKANPKIPWTTTYKAGSSTMKSLD